MSRRTGFEESLAAWGRSIDAALEGVGRWWRGLGDRLRTGRLSDALPRRPVREGPPLRERLEEARQRAGERLGGAGPGLVVGAFAAGGVVVGAVVLGLVLGLGLFRGDAVTGEELARDAALREAAARAQATRDGVVSPADLVRTQQADRAARGDAAGTARGASGSSSGSAPPRAPAGGDGRRSSPHPGGGRVGGG